MKKNNNTAVTYTDGMKIKFDMNNPKTGGILGVSISPLFSCPKNTPCYIESLKAIKEGRAPICYYLRGNRFEGGTKKNGLQDDSIMRKALYNYEIFAHNPGDYFAQIQKAARSASFFRWHDGGDIVNEEYLKGMIETAKICKHTRFTFYTKKYNLINNFISKGGKLPKNLNCIFSLWAGYPCNNPYNFPTFEAVDQAEIDANINNSDVYICPCSYKTHKEHTCHDCIAEGGGCYLAKKYQRIIEKLH